MAEFGLSSTEALRGTLTECRGYAVGGGGCAGCAGCVGCAGCGTDDGRRPEASDGVGAGAKGGTGAGAGVGANVGAGANMGAEATPGEATEFPSDEEPPAVTLKLLARFLGT